MYNVSLFRNITMNPPVQLMYANKNDKMTKNVQKKEQQQTLKKHP
jgi:hypothetical protein